MKKSQGRGDLAWAIVAGAVTDAPEKPDTRLAPRPAGGLSPLGIGAQKPRHYREMLDIGAANWRHPLYALRVLRQGVCDGCALGTSGLSDWTMDGVHLCLTRLRLLRLNTLDALPAGSLSDAAALGRLDGRALMERGRLDRPYRRRRGEPGFSPLSWDAALAELGERIGGADPDRIACYMTSRGLGNEAYFAAQKAFRLLGSPHVDNAARLCHSPSTAAMKRVLGVAASTCSYRDWYDADLVVFIGSNPANDQPVAVKYLDEARRGGTRVAVVNPYREPGMERYWIPSTPGSAVFGSRITDYFFHVTTGGDQAFLQGVQKLLIEGGHVDHSFIDQHTTGYGDYAEALAALDLEALAARAGSTREAVERFAELLADARKVVFVWSMGLTQHAGGTRTIEALCCLGVSMGFVGRPGTGLMPIRGHSGVQGGAEMGAYATVFPGGRPIDDAEANRLEALWGFRPPARVGMDTCSMLAAADAGRLSVLYAVGGNFLDTLPQPADVERALGRVPTRVHQDIVINRSMLVEPAEVVYLLPARTRYEHAGGITQTTTERRVVFSPHVPGHRVGEAREEWRILADVARAARPERAALLGLEDAEAIRRDIGRTIDRYAPIAELRAAGDQFQWGGPRLCEAGHFGHADGKARFVYSEAPDAAAVGDQLRLSTRRGKQFNSMLLGDVDPLTGAGRDHLLMNADDMRERGLSHDSDVVVESEHGRMNARAFAAPLTRGNVQAHWPEANVLIGAGRVDSGGLVPDYNAHVRVRAAEHGGG